MVIKNAGKDNKEVEKLVIELGKKGMTAEKIGLILKQEHKIKNVKKEKSISKILRENNLYEDPDLKNIKLNAETLRKHLEKNRLDHPAKKALVMLDARLRKVQV
jgi:ribosomal protein S15P/S13E